MKSEEPSLPAVRCIVWLGLGLPNVAFNADSILCLDLLAKAINILQERMAGESQLVKLGQD